MYSEQKKIRKKSLIIYIRLIGLRGKFYKRIPCKFDLGSFYMEILCVHLQGNPLYFFGSFTGKSFQCYFQKVDFQTDFKKNPTNRVFLNFFIRTPTLSKFIKIILQGNPFTILRLLDRFLKNPTKRVFLIFLSGPPTCPNF